MRHCGSSHAWARPAGVNLQQERLQRRLAVGREAGQACNWNASQLHLGSRCRWPMVPGARKMRDPMKRLGSFAATEKAWPVSHRGCGPLFLPRISLPGVRRQRALMKKRKNGLSFFKSVVGALPASLWGGREDAPIPTTLRRRLRWGARRKAVPPHLCAKNLVPR